MGKKTEVEQLIVSKAAAAKILGVAPTTIDRFTRAGLLPAVLMPSSGTVGRPRRMYYTEDLRKFIVTHRSFVGGVSSSGRPASRNRMRSYGAMSAKEALRKAREDD